MMDIDQQQLLHGELFSMGSTTGVLIVPDLDPECLQGVDFEVPETDEYADGEVLTVYFHVGNDVGYRHYRIEEPSMQAFAAEGMDNLGVLPPGAIQDGVER